MENQAQAVKFGMKQIKKETPEWAKWIFRIFFWVTNVVTLYITIFTTLSPEMKLHIAEGVSFANLAMHSFTKMFGINTEEYEKQYQQ